MKIQRVLDGGIFADGGSVFCRVLLNDDSTLEFGLDARVPRTKSERMLYVGASYPTTPGALHLARGSDKEADIVAAVREYVDRTCGFLRREALLEADQASLNEQDSFDRHSLIMLRALLDR